MPVPVNRRRAGEPSPCSRPRQGRSIPSKAWRKPGWPIQGLGQPGLAGSDWVRLAGCPVNPAARQLPGHFSWLRLLQSPARSLFGAMMSAASRVQIALTGAAALVEWLHMIEIAVRGRTTAAGSRAGPLPDLDQVPQRGRRPVAAGLARVTAPAGLQDLQPCAQTPGPTDCRFAATRTGAGAGVADRSTVGIRHRQAPPGGATGRQHRGKVAPGCGVHRAEPGHIGSRAAAQPGRQRHGEVDCAGHGWPAGRVRAAAPDRRRQLGSGAFVQRPYRQQRLHRPARHQRHENRRPNLAERARRAVPRPAGRFRPEGRSSTRSPLRLTRQW